MALPPYGDMVEPILRFGIAGDIDGVELRNNLPSIMGITGDDLSKKYSPTGPTMFEMHLRHAIKNAGESGWLINLGKRRYRLTPEGRAWLASREIAPAVATKASEEIPDDGTPLSRICRSQIRSEKEVEIRFVVPLLVLLGYGDDDREDGQWINIRVGSGTSRVEADFVCYSGPEHKPETCLLVVEVKAPRTSLSEALEQAKSYASQLKPLRIVVTDGLDTQVWQTSEFTRERNVFSFKRSELFDRFPDLLAIVGKAALTDMKRERIRASESEHHQPTPSSTTHDNGAGTDEAR
jgi:Type I restriction enzyme R protein N terminus (HSDR_N)